jgi:hypothetical protein
MLSQLPCLGLVFRNHYPSHIEPEKAPTLSSRSFQPILFSRNFSFATFQSQLFLTITFQSQLFLAITFQSQLLFATLLNHTSSIVTLQSHLSTITFQSYFFNRTSSIDLFQL